MVDLKIFTNQLRNYMNISMALYKTAVTPVH